MTHGELVKAAARWLKANRSCAIVCTELVTASPETADAIGWRSCGQHSILVECKVSRADFFRDARKIGRRMGSERYYFTPPGLISVDELPAGWGLIEFDGLRLHTIRKAGFPTDKNRQRELNVLYSILLRAAGRSPLPRNATIEAIPENDPETAKVSE